MSSQGRGRGLRRNFDGGSEKPGGLKSRGEKFSSDTGSRSSEEEPGRAVKTHGDSPVPDTFSTADLLDLVDRLSLDKVEDTKSEQARKVTKCIKHLCCSDEALRSVIEELHRKSLESEEFGRKAARAFGNVSQLEVSGVKLRDVVLRNIQTDFKRKEEILSQDEATFLNAVSLLCEVFEHMRLADGTVINVLAVPILEYCDLLLSSQSHAALNLLGRQLQVIGEEVQRSKPEKFTDFLLKVRGMLVSDKLAPVTRAVLLHVLELHLLRWPSLLPDKTAEWYAGLLGARVMVRRQQTAAASSSLATTRTANGHAKVKEEGLTAEDELVLQRVLGGGGGAPVSPHSPGYPYYEGGVARAGPPHPHMQYNTPPPNMLPSPGHQYSVQPPGPARFVTGEARRQPRPPSGPPGKVDMNGVERLAVDMMTMGLPPQVSPPAPVTASSSRPGGWHAMPPAAAPLAGQGQTPGPRLPTAIVPPGVPPHIRPPAQAAAPSQQWSPGQAPDSRPRSNPASGGWSAMPAQAGRGADPRPGGSGRIMPGAAQPHDSKHWNAPNSGPGSWNGSQRGGGGGGGSGRDNDVFDIGTWENPGDSSGGGSVGGGSGGGGGWDRQGSGSAGRGGGWDDQASSKQWSRQEGMGSSNESQWSAGDGDNKWSANDGSGSHAWSANDSKDDASFGTWENPKSRPSLKPMRNDEVRNWSSGDTAGGWGEGAAQVTPTKADWANSSAGSEISPGSAWKKEASVVGNWADDLQSPRDKDENPLDASLKEARRSLSNW